jgi:hypothetical protein
LAALLLALAPAVAQAQPSKSGVDVNLWFGHIDGGSTGPSVNAWNPEASLLLSLGSFGIGANVGAVADSITGGGSGTSRFLNPFVGAYYGIGAGPLEAQIGLGLSIPVNSTSDIGDVAALLAAAAAHGTWNYWAYLPNGMAIVVPARVSAGLLGLVGVAGEGALGIRVGTSNNAGNDFIYQLAAEAYLGLGIEPGLRLQLVHVPTTSSPVSDPQLSAMPFVRIGAGPVHLELGFTYNLTSPLGPSSDSGKAFGAHAGVSFTL